MYYLLPYTFTRLTQPFVKTSGSFGIFWVSSFFPRLRGTENPGNWVWKIRVRGKHVSLYYLEDSLQQSELKQRYNIKTILITFIFNVLDINVIIAQIAGFSVRMFFFLGLIFHCFSLELSDLVYCILLDVFTVKIFFIRCITSTLVIWFT